MNAAQIKETVSIVEVLDKYLGINLPMRGTKASFPCPIHQGTNNNFAIDTDKNIATCFSKCGKTWNVIDLVIEIHNTDFKGAIGLIERDFLQGGSKTPKTKRKAPVSAPTLPDAKPNFNNLYKTLSQDDYFLNRGLSQEIIEKYGLGAVTEETDLSSFSDKEKYSLKFRKYIIPISSHFFIARLDESKGEGNKYQNFGQAELLNKQYVGDTSKTFVFVTEGAIDALTIETLGYNAVALNSVANASLLVKEIQLNENNARQQQFILFADNDEAGKELENKLKKSFKDMNMTIYIGKMNGDFKDINELAVDNPDGAADVLQASIDECINGNSAFNILLDYFMDIKPVTPIPISNFPKLNDVIGGLRTSLYVVGAASSLGKTTFVQEIADQVASNGNHVLFFSLEMGKKELVAKSLVRTMGELKKSQKIKGEITYSRDLLSGNIKDHNIFSMALGHYEKTAKNLFIHEGMFDIDVITIRQEIEKHIRLHNVKPLVIVDYLQILSPLNDRLSEKQATDKNITELKRMTRDLDIPLIAISSFNRENYNKEASFSSFKESGAIEYGSDVVLALELQKIKELEKDSNGKAKEAEKLNEAKGTPIREINLKVLKNRFGKAFEEIQYSYITALNKFEENGSEPKAKTSEKRI